LKKNEEKDRKGVMKKMRNKIWKKKERNEILKDKIKKNKNDKKK
jgi:hypothetical protein